MKITTHSSRPAPKMTGTTGVPACETLFLSIDADRKGAWGIAPKMPGLHSGEVSSRGFRRGNRAATKSRVRQAFQPVAIQTVAAGRCRASRRDTPKARLSGSPLRVWLLIAGIMALLALTGPWQMARAQGEISTTVADQIALRLVCQCGCQMILPNCVHQECMSRDQMTAAIKTQLGQGRTPDQIVQAFVQTYGEQVLAEPPKKGFNLTAWTAPFVGLVAGAFLIALLLRAWVFRGKEAEVSESSAPAPVEDEYLSRVDKEIKELP